MKRLIVLASVTVLSLPLIAQDKPNTTTTVLAQPASPTTEDSPLVKAAKKTKKSTAKKGIVITNENLQKTGGHLFVANPSTNPPLPALAPPQPETAAAKLDAAQLKLAAEAKAKKKDQAAKKDLQTKAAAADLNGESIEERIDDPAMQEHVMEQMTSTQPQTTTASQPQTAQPTKPPEY
jgi:hypothetical protein